MDRRTLLRGGCLLAALPLAACTDEPPAAPDPDDALRAAAAERERALLAEHDAVLLVLPALAERLLPVRAEHAEHLLALTGGPSASPTASADRGAPPAEVPPPPTAQAALAGLVAAETAAAGMHREGALAARDGDLAALLASLSASEASHPVALA